MKKAVYPGSFDPITNGHVNIIERAAKLFDRLIVAVADNTSKSMTFTAEERIALIRKSIRAKNVDVRRAPGLTVDFVRKAGARVIVRGIRSGQDFELELAIAWNNRRLAPGLETLFLLADDSVAHIKSSIVKEIARNGGNVRSLVPAVVNASLKERLGARSGKSIQSRRG
ncbi:MAG: pantetheine-phosphate adenylyltransferase [Planctomycetes bacterium]|nr:pantetheine-phosphate adenylyltransferase [Planctomycetota bacterium]